MDTTQSHILAVGICILTIAILALLSPTKLFTPTANLHNRENNSTSQPSTRGDAKIKINNTEIAVELATTTAEKQNGLSFRPLLQKNTGMLFDFSKEPNAIPRFWMKDMRFNIDMIWIKDNKILFLHKNVPAPEDPEGNLPTYAPPSPIDYILEVNAGWSDEHNIKIGDAVEIKK